MADFKTPQKFKKVQDVKIPPSPFMRKLGYGTGIAVYHLERSPRPNQTRSPWALKKLIDHRTTKQNKEIKERLLTEAEILRKLDHPNIVGFRALVNRPGQQPCLAMEECATSLGDMNENRLDEGLGPYPAEQMFKVALDVSKALDYLHHKAFLLHCDVKSYNVLIKGDFAICKLCDFGVCLPVKADGTLVEVDEETDYPGTLLWAPPEVNVYPPVITIKADVYSYGLTLWEMLSLTPPYSGTEGIDSEIDESNLDDSKAELKQMDESFSKKSRPELPDVDLGEEYDFLLELFYLCTEDDYRKRPDIGELVDVLQDVAKSQGGS